MKNYDVIVIGAGASGLLAAGRAASLGASVLVTEKMRQAGRKLLITGKGRCNISNSSDMDQHFSNIRPNPLFLRTAYYEFFHEDIVELLEENGLRTQVERGNRIFPENNKAAEVLAAIKKWLAQYPIDFIYDCNVSSILAENGTVVGIETSGSSGKNRIEASKVILCTGGRSYPATGSTGDGYRMAADLGHTINATRPALVPLVTAGNIAPALQGLSLKNVNAVLWIEGKKVTEEFGEMMFAHFGLTGPVILTLSRKVVDALREGKKTEISIDLKPALNEEKLDRRLLRDLDGAGKKQLDNILRGLLPARMVPVFLDLLRLDGKKEASQVKAQERKKILNLLKDFRFRVIDFRGFKEAIITAGGISTKEINSKTMESRIINGLFFAGEVIDLDANTGGYNLQIAWSTGWLAGSWK